MKEKFFIPRDKRALEIAPEMCISRDELKHLVSEELNGKLEENFRLYMADFEYYCPPFEDAKEIIESSKIKGMTTIVGKERFDCDDFSLLLKARFAYAAYRDKRKRNFAHCFGIVWGMLPFPFPHSLNWMVTADDNGNKTLHFVEPQNYKVFPPRPRDKCIYFMLV